MRLFICSLALILCSCASPDDDCDRFSPGEGICITGSIGISDALFDKDYAATVECVGFYFPPPPRIRLLISDEYSPTGATYLNSSKIDITSSTTTPAYLVSVVYRHELVHTALISSGQDSTDHNNPLFGRCAPGSFGID